MGVCTKLFHTASLAAFGAFLHETWSTEKPQKIPCTIVCFNEGTLESPQHVLRPQSNQATIITKWRLHFGAATQARPLTHLSQPSQAYLPGSKRGPDENALYPIGIVYHFRKSSSTGLERSFCPLFSTVLAGWTRFDCFVFEAAGLFSGRV